MKDNKVSNEERSSKGKEMRKNAMSAILNGIMGIGRLLVVVSIIYSTSVIWMGTDGIVPKAMTVPAAVLAAMYVIDNFVIRRSK